MKRGKVGKLESDKRMSDLIKDLGKGMFRYQLQEKYAPLWGVDPETIDNYIGKAYKILKTSFTDEDLVARYNHIWEKTVDENPEIARKTIDSIVKLKKGDRVEVSGNFSINIIMPKQDDESE